MGALLGRAAAAPAPQADADQCPEPPQSAVPCSTLPIGAPPTACAPPCHPWTAVYTMRHASCHTGPSRSEPQCTPGTSCMHVAMLLDHVLASPHSAPVPCHDLCSEWCSSCSHVLLSILAGERQRAPAEALSLLFRCVVNSSTSSKFVQHHRRPSAVSLAPDRQQTDAG